jgi:thiol-disulfide isomerase/thioredoxin
MPYDCPIAHYLQSMKRIGILLVIAALGVGIYVYQNNAGEAAKKMATEKAETMKRDVMAKADELKDEAVEKSEEMAGSAAGKIVDTTMKKVDSMQKDVMEKVDTIRPGIYKESTGTPVSGMKNVLFFHASWCPTCRAADANIKANLLSIPSGLTIHQVDYDSSTELKKKYGVTYQHTFVQVDESGTLIKKWSGGGLDEIKAEIM